MNAGEAPETAVAARLREHEEAVLRALRRIIRAVDLYSRQLAAGHALTGPQLICLRELAASGPLASGRLAAAVHLSQPTLTGILDRLEERGLVARVRDRTDRRKVLVELTAPGRKLLEQAPPPLQEQFLARFAALTEREQEGIRRSLEQIVAMMEATRLEAAPMLAPTGSLDEPDRGGHGAAGSGRARAPGT